MLDTIINLNTFYN